MFNFEVKRWMYFFVIGLSTLGTIIIEMKIDRIVNCREGLQSFFSKNDDADDVYHPGIHIPMARQYPLKERSVKVDLIVGIVCILEPYYIKNCKEAIRSALEQLKAEKNITVEVYVGILSQNEEDWRFMAKNFDDMSSVKIRFITLSPKRLERRMNNKDLDVLDHKFHASFMKRMAAVNMLLGLMHWHAAHEGKYFWHMEANFRAKKGALKPLKDYRRHLEGWNKFGFRVNKLYDINSSRDLANHLYFMGPYGTFFTLRQMFMQYKGGALLEDGNVPELVDLIDLDKPKTSMKNPPATIETNLNNITDSDPRLITDPYKKGTHFRGTGANKETYIRIKFGHIVSIKRIVIETGLDIYLQYPILLAILKKADYFQNGECKNFKRIGDFRQGQIDLSFDETPLKAACLMIQWVEQEKQDVCLNSINIYT